MAEAHIEQGYDVERFENEVSKNYHCVICFNVFKEPVMCRNNEHIFCRACITRHLQNSQTCPSCMDELSVDTLRQVSRFVTECLAELKIRCEYFERGCQFVELGELERHVKECGYAPAVCSNEECKLEVNKRDLIHHETAICEQRKVKCHHCEEMKQKLNKVNKKLENLEAKFEEKFTEISETLKQINEILLKQDDKLNQLAAERSSSSSIVTSASPQYFNKEDLQIPEDDEALPEYFRRTKPLVRDWADAKPWPWTKVNRK